NAIQAITNSPEDNKTEVTLKGRGGMEYEARMTDDAHAVISIPKRRTSITKFFDPTNSSPQNQSPRYSTQVYAPKTKSVPPSPRSLSTIVEEIDPWHDWNYSEEYEEELQ